ncbi:hypothetical protein Cadr_000028581 [Camelus dromedarius]|uniref:Uncharacterized protein n=1 Tax=Camelus dromedarius TaxID=9838 RepID=A0A5N4CHG3_CAMDR|nr:hypothetical protein Cadr_000028581 [Camelus dromedarius]
MDYKKERLESENPAKKAESLCSNQGVSSVNLDQGRVTDMRCRGDVALEGRTTRAFESLNFINKRTSSTK